MKNNSEIFEFSAYKCETNNEMDDEELIDYATCSTSLLFCEYYFKLYININKIIADGVFLYPQSKYGMLWHT